jgi:hypothetical protein
VTAGKRALDFADRSPTQRVLEGAALDVMFVHGLQASDATPPMTTRSARSRAALLPRKIGSDFHPRLPTN